MAGVKKKLIIKRLKRTLTPSQRRRLAFNNNKV